MGRKSVLSTEEKEQIVSMYKDGILISKIKDAIGYSDTVIDRVLQEYGIERIRKARKIPSDKIPNMVKLYNEGYSYEDIAEKLNLNVSRSTVYETLKQENVIRGYDPNKIMSIIYENGRLVNGRQYYFDEHIFDSIDTPDKAYCIGLFMADGYNNADHSTFRISLQDTDKSVLEKIKIMFQADNSLHYIPAKPERNMKHDVYEFQVRSKYFTQRLTELGIVQNKSLILKFPRWMPEYLIPYMLKGYIDGDGWVQKYHLGFMSTKDFCEGAKEYLNSIGIECTIMDMKKHYNENTKILYMSNRNNIIPLAEIMFSHGNLYIDRKHDKYIEYGFLGRIDKSLSA